MQEVEYPHWLSQSPDLSLRGEDWSRGKDSKKQELKEAAVKLWESITREDTKGLLMSVGQRIQAVFEKVLNR